MILDLLSTLYTKNILICLSNNCTNKFQTNLWVLWYTLRCHSLKMSRFQSRSFPCWDINTALICVYIFCLHVQHVVLWMMYYEKFRAGRILWSYHDSLGQVDCEELPCRRMLFHCSSVHQTDMEASLSFCLLVLYSEHNEISIISRTTFEQHSSLLFQKERKE